MMRQAAVQRLLPATQAEPSGRPATSARRAWPRWLALRPQAQRRRTRHGRLDEQPKARDKAADDPRALWDWFYLQLRPARTIAERLRGGPDLVRARTDDPAAL